MKFSLKYPLLAASIIIVIKLTTYFTHSQFSSIGRYSGIFSLALLFIPLGLAIKERRDKELHGFISLKQVMRTGLYVSVIASLIVALFNAIYFKFIDREILAYWLAESEKSLHNLKSSEEDIKKASDYLTDFYSPFSQAIGGLTGVLGVGTILSFILATFLMKDSPHAEN